MLTCKQTRAQAAMRRRLAEVGIHYDLSQVGIQEVDELLEQIRLSVQESLEGRKLNEHARLTEAFGLPMPFLDEEQRHPDAPADQKTGRVHKHYGLEGKDGHVVEDPQNSDGMDGLRTLQFNSLCIKRADRPEAERSSWLCPTAVSDIGVLVSETPDDHGGV
jgi:hypothetical protein